MQEKVTRTKQKSLHTVKLVQFDTRFSLNKLSSTTYELKIAIKFLDTITIFYLQIFS